MRFPFRSNIFSYFGFCIFASFLNCDSNLSSYPGFDFLSVVFECIPIFLPTNFALSYIKSFIPGCCWLGYLSIGRPLSLFRT